jgi:uncharacterized protein (DUF1697 family)
MRYAAFLRGINVGGNAQVSMEALRQTLTAAGLHDVTTLLNSGNVVFEAAETDGSTLARAIERTLEERFGRRIGVIVRTASDIAALVASEPFQGIGVTRDTRLYVTFLGDITADGAPGGLDVPYEAADGTFTILRVAGGAVCSVVTLLPQHGTLDVMQFLEQRYGKAVTTRNWNTILKVRQRLG